MYENKIMKPGEKLNATRKILHMTQEELAEGICSKNNISLIENGRQNLSYSLAIEFVEKFNKCAKDEGMGIKLTPEELILDEDSQANNIFLEMINQLKEIQDANLFEKKLIEIEDLIQKYSIEEQYKIELYRLTSDFYYNEFEYNKSEVICNIGLKIAISLKNNFGEAVFYINKSRNSIALSDYSRALEQLDYAEKISNDNELSIRIYFNKALVYKKTKQYCAAIKYLSRLINEFEINNERRLLEIKMLYANCLNDTHKFKDAEKEYIEIMAKAMRSNDKSLLALVYRNLSELYFNKEEYKEAAKYIKESLENNKDGNYRNQYLQFAAKVFKKINRYNQVEDYLLQALENSEKKDKDNLKLIEEIIYELVLFYIDKDREKDLIIMAEKSKKLNIDYSLIYTKIGSFLLKKNNKDGHIFLEKSTEKMEKNKNIMIQ